MEINKKEKFKDKLDKIEENYKKDVYALKKRFIIDKVKILLVVVFNIVYAIVTFGLILNTPYYEIGIILLYVWVLSFIFFVTIRMWIKEYREEKSELIRMKQEQESRVFRDDYDDGW